MFKNYLKVACRSLLRNKVFALINILGLALGISSSLLIFLWVRDELRMNKFHRDIDRIYSVYGNIHYEELATWNTTPAPLASELTRDIPEIEAAAKILWSNQYLLKAGDKAFKEEVRYTNPDFFRVFSFPVVPGTPGTLLTQPDEIVLTEKLARKYFGDASPVGKTIRVVNLNQDFRVSGVMRDVPAASAIQFGALLPIGVFEKENPWTQKWGNFTLNTYVKLAPGASYAKAAAKLKHYIDRKDPAQKGLYDLMLQPFGDVYLYSHFENGYPAGGRIEEVRLFAVVAVFVLLIACINFMNLATARSAKRAKEVGIRKVVGATRLALKGQFMAEALLVTLLAVVVSQVVVYLVLPLYNDITGKKLLIDYRDATYLAGLAGILIVTGAVAGSYPALFLSRLQPVRILKGTLAFSTESILLRKGLVVFQFVLSITLIVGTLVIYRQMEYIRHKNLGFDRENLVYVAVEGDLGKNLDAFKQDLSRSASIKAVSAGDNLPNAVGGSSGDLQFPGQRPGEMVQVAAFSISENYLATVGVQLAAGRDFAGKKDSANYIVNETAVRLMRLKGDPIGQEISFWNGKGRIIGVTKDFHIHSIHNAIAPLVMVYGPENVNYVLARVEGQRTADALAHLEQVYRKYLPGYPVEYHFLDEAFEQQYRSEAIVGQLTNYFSFLGIFIACLGLLGLAISTAEQRMKEIGIRKVLGASVANLVALLSKDFLKLVAIAFVIATPLAWYAVHQWLQKFEYKTHVGWWIFALAGLIAGAIALFTVSFQSVKAALTNPVKSLRSE